MKIFIKLLLIIFLTVFSDISCISQSGGKEVYLDFEKIYFYKPKHINKKKRIATFNLPLYSIKNDSPFMPIIKEYISAWNEYNNKKHKNADKIFSEKVSFIHFRDDSNHSPYNPTRVAITWMNGEQDKMYRIPELHFEGVLVVDNHYFLLTEAVASFFKKDAKNSQITVDCPYIEYDLSSEDRRRYRFPENGFYGLYKL